MNEPRDMTREKNGTLFHTTQNAFGIGVENLDSIFVPVGFAAVIIIYPHTRRTLTPARARPELFHSRRLARAPASRSARRSRSAASLRNRPELGGSARGTSRGGEGPRVR